MKPYTWKPEHTAEEAKDGAYWERNMLALTFANYMNDVARATLQGMVFFKDMEINEFLPCGWYHHGDESYVGWSRVISLNEGRVTFHIPDDFDLGTLPEIESNWDGHTTEEKWLNLMELCGCKID